jgi:hypothetical protein
VRPLLRLIVCSFLFLPTLQAAKSSCKLELELIDPLIDRSLLSTHLPAIYAAEASTISTPQELLERFPFNKKVTLSSYDPLGSGSGYSRLEKGFIVKENPKDPPEEIFIKVPDTVPLEKTNETNQTKRELHRVSNEAYWSQYLSDQGWGVKFYGLKKMSDSRIGIVTEYLRGSFYSSDGRKTVDTLSFEQKISARKRLFAMKKWFLENKIAPRDLQIRFNDQGIPYIVDPEFFRPMDSQNLKDEQKETEALFDDYISKIRLI